MKYPIDNSQKNKRMGVMISHEINSVSSQICASDSYSFTWQEKSKTKHELKKKSA